MLKLGSPPENTGYFLSSNLEALYPILESDLPLSELLVSDPNSYYIVRKNQFFWSSKYLWTWRWKNFFGTASQQEHLNRSLNATMNLFFETIANMEIFQKNYRRHLSNFINNKHFDTGYLADNRARLKSMYDDILPFMRKLRKTDSRVVRELLAERFPELEVRNIEQTVPSIKTCIGSTFKSVDKGIVALIELECLYGDLLPYNTLIADVFLSKPAALENIRLLTANIFPLIDFKTTYRALHYIHQATNIQIPNFPKYFDLLFKNAIPLVKLPDEKLDTFRRSLKKGSTIEISPGQTITLDDRLSPYKEGFDGRIIFKIVENPDLVIIFYPNRLYYSFIQKRIKKKSCLELINTIPTYSLERKYRWSIEPYLENQPLPFDNFLDLVHQILIHGPLTTIDFTTITIDPRYSHLNNPVRISLKPIYKGGDDYAAFVESLISYYQAGYYHDQCPTLHHFLTECLSRSKPKHREFFITLAQKTLDLNFNSEPNELKYVVDDGVASHTIISNSTKGFDRLSPVIFRDRCHKFVNEIYQRRENYLDQLVKSQKYTTEEISSLLHSFNKHITEQVQAWILPPQ